MAKTEKQKREYLRNNSFCLFWLFCNKIENIRKDQTFLQNAYVSTLMGQVIHKCPNIPLFFFFWIVFAPDYQILKFFFIQRLKFSIIINYNCIVIANWYVFQIKFIKIFRTELCSRSFFVRDELSLRTTVYHPV